MHGSVKGVMGDCHSYFDFADTLIRAIGIAVSHAYEAPKPLECVFHAIADTHFTGSRTAFHGKADTVSR